MGKKLLTMIALTGLVLVANAQTQLYELIKSIDWNSTEAELIQKHQSGIQKRGHYYNDKDQTMIDYEFTNIAIGQFIGNVYIGVDSITKKIQALGFSPKIDEKYKDAPIVLSREMDKVLFEWFGEPDNRKEELDSEVMKSIDRTWYTNDRIIESRHLIFSDMHLYSLKVKNDPNSKKNDFRVAKWGDSKESVIQKEGKENEVNHEDIYMFSDYVAGLSCSVAYVFSENKLTMAKYLFKPSHTNKNDFITDYDKIVELISEKYGLPNSNAPKWKNTLYKSDRQDYGFAISLGHLSYSAVWLGETTDITVALYGDNYKISLVLEYVSKKYEQYREKVRKKTLSRGL